MLCSKSLVVFGAAGDRGRHGEAESYVEFVNVVEWLVFSEVLEHDLSWRLGEVGKGFAIRCASFLLIGVMVDQS
jgi:hypothetical protein